MESFGGLWHSMNINTFPPNLESSISILIGRSQKKRKHFFPTQPDFQHLLNTPCSVQEYCTATLPRVPGIQTQSGRKEGCLKSADLVVASTLLPFI